VILFYQLPKLNLEAIMTVILSLTIECGISCNEDIIEKDLSKSCPFKEYGWSRCKKFASFFLFESVHHNQDPYFPLLCADYAYKFFIWLYFVQYVRKTKATSIILHKTCYIREKEIIIIIMHIIKVGGPVFVKSI